MKKKKKKKKRIGYLDVGPWQWYGTERAHRMWLIQDYFMISDIYCDSEGLWSGIVSPDPDEWPLTATLSYDVQDVMDEIDDALAAAGWNLL